MKKGSAQIPLVLVLLVLAVALPVLTWLVNQNTENRSKASGSCSEQCPGSDGTLRSCTPPDSDGTANESLCSSGFVGRVETCGGLTNYWCCNGSSWSQTMTTECAAKLTPTVAPTPTAVPTPIGGIKTLKFVFAYAGVRPEAKCVNDWPIKVVVSASDGTAKSFNSVVPTKSTGTTSTGLAKYQVSLTLTDFNYASNLAVFIKGSKHIQVKYGKDGQTSFYSQPNGTIGIADDPSSSWLGFDFTGYPLLAGDVNQDGVVDGRDFSQVKTAAIARTTVVEGGDMIEDLNGNCAMESQDVGILMITLNQKQDQLY